MRLTCLWRAYSPVAGFATRNIAQGEAVKEIAQRFYPTSV
jgi:hypothetical protein